jgi:peptidoglycan/LPS O-acetylase OafA/YrhL
MENSKAPRRNDIDALRVIAVLLLIVFHSARAFDLETWHVKNNELVAEFQILTSFISQWHMPLLFMLSGAGTYLALNFRSGRQYALDRFKRLFLPLVFGICLIIPPQVYFERIGNSPYRLSPINFQGSYLDFYPHFFEPKSYPEGNFSWHHLWFLPYLFVFSLVALPLFLYLKKPAGQALLEKLIRFLEKGPRIFWLALLPIISEIALRRYYPGVQNLINDWANFILYLTMFIYGFVVVTEPRLMMVMVRYRRLALSLGTGLVTLLLATGDLAGLWPNGLPYELRMVVRGLGMWCWLIAILGYGHKYLNRDSKLLGYTRELVSPFYIWHQTVIVAIAFYVVQWQTGVIEKYLIIGLGSLIVTGLLCELVKLTNPTRFVFGLPSKKVRRVIGSQPETAKVVARID